MKLHGYFRSSAAYRVRIALGLKGLEVGQAFHVRKGEQRAPDYLVLNPQGLVPVLETDTGALTQSLAILEWLDETYPEPALLPKANPFVRAQVRAFALAIACDIHPLQNLRVLARLKEIGLNAAAQEAWPRWVVGDGLAACEQLLVGQTGPFCFGATPTIADICLVPQMGSARRFNVDITGFPRLRAAEAACLALPAFTAAAPDKQPDAE
ncbi:MAG: maiA [Rhodospirillales bacterium]|nr:maiA [Rhodospirillales bacterium]